MMAKGGGSKSKKNDDVFYELPLRIGFNLSISIRVVVECEAKDTNRKIRITEFVYIYGSKNHSSSSTVNTGEV